MLRRLGPVALVAVLALAPAAGAAKKRTVKLAPKGATTLALSKGAADALQSLGIAVAPLAPARAGDAGIPSRSPPASWTRRPTPAGGRHHVARPHRAVHYDATRARR